MVDPAAGGVAYLPWYTWFKLYGEDFIRKLGEVRPQVFSGTNPASAALASGDIAVLFNASETGLMPLQSAGAPLRWTFPEPAAGPVTGRRSRRARRIPTPRSSITSMHSRPKAMLSGKSSAAHPRASAIQDQRPIAAQPWYKYPTKFFELRPARSNKPLPESFGTVP